MDAIMEYFRSIETATLMGWAWTLIGAILILVLGRWVVKLITAMVRRVMTKRQMDSMLIGFLGSILYVILLVCVIVAAIGYVGIPVTPLIAVLGAAGLAVALALQGSLSNFASGVMLISFHPFRSGDYVEAGEVSGTIGRVGMFYTVLTTPDNKEVTVPNRLITENPITNYSANTTRRIDLIVGVAYKDDLEAARDAIAGVLEQHEKVLDEPESVIMLMDLADSSINFAVRPWVNVADYWPVRGELLWQIKEALEAAGCSIPFPQRDLHMFQESPSSGPEPRAA